MKIGQGWRGQMSGKQLGPVRREFDTLMAGILEGWNVQHDAEGAHTAVTADSLTVDDRFELGGPWEQDGSPHILSTAQITTDQNDYRPENVDKAVILRLQSDAARTITGLFQYDIHLWRYLLLINVGNFDITLAHNTTSTAVYRLGCPGSMDYVLQTGESVWLLYDNSAGNWRVLGPVTGGGGGMSATPTAHASTHENGGSDEITVDGLSGELADPQTVNVAADGALDGDGSADSALSVRVDGSSITKSSNNLQAWTIPVNGTLSTTTSTNPQAALGYGTWALYATARGTSGGTMTYTLQ